MKDLSVFTRWVIGITSALATAGVVGGFTGYMSQNSQLAEIRKEIAVMTGNIGETDFGVLNERLGQLLDDDERDQAQDAKIKDLTWKYRKSNTQNWMRDGWAKQQINQLRVIEGLPLENWPNLTVPEMDP